MKETPISNIEKSFITEAIFQGKRTDGRHLDERRNLEIHFGHDFGSCLVSLGETKVSAQVSCSVLEPRPTRPNEGLVFIHVEFLPMSSPRFVNKSKNSDEEINEVTRILERNIKESKAVDTESLCIVAEEQVFAIRLDIKVLNHEGNVIDCSSIAALAALCHYRRPDVSVSGDKITVHTVQDKDPVKLSINHYPVCTTYGFFCRDNDKMVIKDPTGLEEAIMDGKIVLGMNPYKEICTLHLAGKMLIEKSVVLKLVNSAAENAKTNVEIIKRALERDESLRSTGQELGLVNSMKRLDSILNNERKPQVLDLDKLTMDDKTSVPQVLEQMHEQKVQKVEEGIVEMVSEESESESDVETVQEVKAAEKSTVLDEIEIDDDDSEEEETQTLTGQDLKQGGRNWYPEKLK